jgi:DNA repair protein RAD50
MASIEEMLIRGIRSFDPNHPQRVKFHGPLTLIVGHNGAGTLCFTQEKQQ